jgi:hypothetical protein
MANNFDLKQNSLDMDGLAPFVPHCVYQASIIQAQLIRERNDISSIQGLQSLQRMLTRYDERWKIAGKPIFLTLAKAFYLSSKADWRRREIPHKHEII